MKTKPCILSWQKTIVTVIFPGYAWVSENMTGNDPNMQIIVVGGV